MTADGSPREPAAPDERIATIRRALARHGYPHDLWRIRSEAALVSVEADLEAARGLAVTTGRLTESHESLAADLESARQALCEIAALSAEHHHPAPAIAAAVLDHLGAGGSVEGTT